MRITVRPRGETVEINFSERDGMKESVTITHDDAQQLRELLATEEGGSFETSRPLVNPRPKP